MARAAGLPPAVEAVLSRAQSALFDVGASLANPSGKGASVGVADADVAALETAIDALEAGLEPLRTFILPAGAEGAVRLHVARTVVRRAERAVGWRSRPASPSTPRSCAT